MLVIRSGISERIKLIRRVYIIKIINRVYIIIQKFLIFVWVKVCICLLKICTTKRISILIKIFERIIINICLIFFSICIKIVHRVYVIQLVLIIQLIKIINRIYIIICFFKLRKIKILIILLCKLIHKIHIILRWLILIKQILLLYRRIKCIVLLKIILKIVIFLSELIQ